MNKSRAFVFSFVALALLTPPVFGQGRPRRVGPPPSDESTPSRTAPARTTTTPQRPAPTRTTTTPQRPASGTQTNKPVDLNRPPAPPILKGSSQDPNRDQTPVTAQQTGPKNTVKATRCASILLW
jgi:hypothetical protein